MATYYTNHHHHHHHPVVIILSSLSLSLIVIIGINTYINTHIFVYSEQREAVLCPERIQRYDTIRYDTVDDDDDDDDDADIKFKNSNQTIIQTIIQFKIINIITCQQSHHHPFNDWFKH